MQKHLESVDCHLQNLRYDFGNRNSVADSDTGPGQPLSMEQMIADIHRYLVLGNAAPSAVDSGWQFTLPTEDSTVVRYHSCTGFSDTPINISDPRFPTHGPQ